MRTSSAALLLLAACSQEAAEKPAVAAADDDNRIECALGGAARFTRDCVVEREREVGAVSLVVRHPDGSFRRFMAYDDGGFDTADGVERAEPLIDEDRDDDFEVSVGSDRYRFTGQLVRDAS